MSTIRDERIIILICQLTDIWHKKAGWIIGDNYGKEKICLEGNNLAITDTL